jgi:glutathione S-transferase
MIPALKPPIGVAISGAGDRLWSLWGSTLSPFALKVDALLDYAGVAHRWMPAEGTWREGFADARRVRGISTRKLPLTWPEMSDLDEFPAVPFLLGPAGENLYDSTAIAEWLDATGGVLRPGAAAVLPQGDAALRFAIRLVDEYFDEFGLYMVHHGRWKLAARDNGAGLRLAADMRPLLGPIARLIERRFPPRQVRRMPYLFSVASVPDASFDDLPVRLRPPARNGFPPTHELLEEAYARVLAILEHLIDDRPYLFGERFTLADASAYGQLGMNISDASADAMIRRAAPRVREWLQRIAEADFTASRPEGQLALDGAVEPLLAEIGRIFVPLMQQNAAAYERHLAAGETRFNEAGFDAHRGLYDGELDGHPFRSVAKTFQVRIWRSLLSEWKALTPPDRAQLRTLGLPEL